MQVAHLGIHYACLILCAFGMQFCLDCLQQVLYCCVHFVLACILHVYCMRFGAFWAKTAHEERSCSVPFVCILARRSI